MEKGSFESLFERILREQREQDRKRKPYDTLSDPSLRRERDLITLPIENNLNKFNNPIILEKKLEINKYETKFDKLILENKFIEKKINSPSLFPDKNRLYPQNPVQIQYNPTFTNFNFNSLPLPGITVDTKTRITADNVAEFAYPLAQFVEQVRPDYIIACDRGARIIGLAVHMLYGRLYGALPTQDHSISFRKISRKVPADAVREALRPDVVRMLAATESPTVLVLDDWVATGGTKSLVQELFDELSGGRVNLLYGVMRGSGADVTGSKDSAALGDWHDRADLIGVDYGSTDLRPFRVGSRAALDYRRRMSASIDSFVKDLSLQPIS